MPSDTTSNILGEIGHFLIVYLISYNLKIATLRQLTSLTRSTHVEFWHSTLNIFSNKPTRIGRHTLSTSPMVGYRQPRMKCWETRGTGQNEPLTSVVWSCFRTCRLHTEHLSTIRAASPCLSSLKVGMHTRRVQDLPFSLFLPSLGVVLLCSNFFVPCSSGAPSWSVLRSSNSTFYLVQKNGRGT